MRGGARGLSQLVAGTASRVRWRPYLTVLAYSCRINNRKELHFWFGSRPRGNSQNVVRTVRVVQKTTTGDIAQTVYFYLIRGPRQGRAPRPSPARRRGQSTPFWRGQGGAISGGGIQQAERTSDQGFASLLRDGRYPAVDADEAKCNQIVERQPGGGGQPRDGHAKGFQRFPLVGSEIEIVLVAHAASIRVAIRWSDSNPLH